MTQLAARDDWEWPLSRLPARLAACAPVVRMVMGGSARQAARVPHGHSYGCWVHRDGDRQGRRVGGAEDEVVHCAVVLDEMTGDRQLPIMIGQMRRATNLSGS